MQQRRVRLGDILDDYCPRERRITNHAVVAMIDEEVKQTRCATCSADHEYKQAKAPASRRRKAEGALFDADSELRPVLAAPAAASPPDDAEDAIDAELDEPREIPEADLPAVNAAAPDTEDDAQNEDRAAGVEDEWPVHRRLIRATLPRPEGQVPERKEPDFTVRPTGGRFDGNRNGQRHHRGGQQQQSRGHRPMRHAQGQPGNSRPAGSGGQGGHAQRQGNRAGQPQGQRGGGQPQGQNRGPRHGGGRGPKRGR